MKLLLVFFVWCILFALCWPLALLALVATPLVLLVALPFCLAGVVLRGILAFIGALFLLPARVIGWRPV